MPTTVNSEELLELLQYDRDHMTHFALGEGAIGSMIPTSIIIILFAIIRLVRLFQQRRNQQHDDAIKLEIIEEGHQLANEEYNDAIKLEIIEEGHQLTE